MKITARFVMDRETKGAVRYQEVDAAGQPETVHHAIGTLYMRKAAMPRGEAYPKTVEVVVTAV